MNGVPRVSIVVLTYNNSAILSRCLTSLATLDSMPHEVIVVDNASTDDTAETVRVSHPDVALIVQKENSPVVARNVGFRRARGEFILSLDHDMIVSDSQLLSRGVDLFEQFPGVGLLALKIVDEERPTEALDQHWWYPTPRSAQHSHFYTSYFAEGAAFFRTSALMSAGGYDERFFHVAENVDLALKLLSRDWRILYCPSLVTTELVVSGHLSQRRSKSNAYSLRNRLWVAWMHLSLIRAASFALPRVAVDAYRSIRYRWFDHYLAGLREGLFAPASIRRDRRPLSSATWAEIRRREGVTVSPNFDRLGDITGDR